MLGFVNEGLLIMDIMKPAFYKIPCFYHCRFCTKHGKKERAAKPVPAEMTNVAKIVIPKLIIRFIYYLRNKHQGKNG